MIENNKELIELGGIERASHSYRCLLGYYKNKNSLLEKALLDGSALIMHPKEISLSTLHSRILEHCLYNRKKPWKRAEDFIYRNPSTATAYCLFFLKKRSKRVENLILNEANPSKKNAIVYSEKIIKGRWPELESKILQHKDLVSGILYMKKVLRQPWHELEVLMVRALLEGRKELRYTSNTSSDSGRESLISIVNSYISNLKSIPGDHIEECLNYEKRIRGFCSRHSELIFPYMREHRLDSFPEALPLISSNMVHYEIYILNFYRRKDSNYEKVIKDKAAQSYRYSRDILKGRFLEAEPCLLSSRYRKDYVKLLASF